MRCWIRMAGVSGICVWKWRRRRTCGPGPHRAHAGSGAGYWAAHACGRVRVVARGWLRVGGCVPGVRSQRTGSALAGRVLTHEWAAAAADQSQRGGEWCVGARHASAGAAVLPGVPRELRHGRPRTPCDRRRTTAHRNRVGRAGRTAHVPAMGMRLAIPTVVLVMWGGCGGAVGRGVDRQCPRRRACGAGPRGARPLHPRSAGRPAARA